MFSFRNFLYVLRWKSFYFSATLLIGMSMLYSTAEMRFSDTAYKFKLRNNAFRYEAKIQYHETKERTLRYLEIGKKNLPLIVFIHGAPVLLAFGRTSYATARYCPMLN